MNNKPLNHHLHLFNFYSESHDTHFIENNVTRAFALCLKNNTVLLFAFLKEILSDDDFKYLFYTYEQDAGIDFDMQVDTINLVDDTRRLYAVGLTDSAQCEDWSDLADGIEPVEKKNITDLVITIKDLKIIVEVKRTGENCKEQLQQQLTPFLDKDVDIHPMHITWGTVLQLTEQVSNFINYNSQDNEFLKSFMYLVKRRYNHWLQTKPFKYLPFFKNNSDKTRALEMDRRLLQAMHSIGDDKVSSFWDRTAILLDRPWASEAIPEFELTDEDKHFLALNIWPGNTKQQGYSLYNKSLDWVNRKSISVNGKDYELYIQRHIKFMHFNKYITSIDIPIDETGEWLKKEINTPENHNKRIAGKWDRDSWDKLDSILNEHFKEDWKNECKWHQEFEDSDRSYLTLALGYSVTMYIPYSEIQDIDQQQDDYKKIGQFLIDCVDALVSMVES